MRGRGGLAGAPSAFGAGPPSILRRDGRARGVALHESFNSYVAMVAEVSNDNGSPRVHKVW
ncbi:MAG: hypothetical protein AAFZ09_13170, partial [Pseudomonadota bacterium]